jgi:iron complex outermembrane recepter protein
MFSKPGITSSTFAPGASRPVIRGLDNYRVRIQENGIGSGDVSDFAEDHAVPIDPLTARQIEVIRGPATLRWGSQAIGGVVSVENNRIPTVIPPRPLTGEFKTGATTVDRGREGAVLLDAGGGNFALHADAFARRTTDYLIPGYPYLFPPDPPPVVGSRQPNSALRASGQAVGGSYVFDRGFIGMAVSQFASLYRIPGIEASEVGSRIDMRQTKWTSKGEYRPPSGPIDAVRLWLGASDYVHHELAFENGFDGIQQTFTNTSKEGRLEVQLAPFNLPFAQLTTAVGLQGSRVGLTAPAASGPTDGLFDPNLTRMLAGFVFNEFKFTDTLKMQIAGRIEQARVVGSSPDFPADLVPTGMDLVDVHRNRTFEPKSAAIGFLKDLPLDLVWSLTGQHVERAPRAPELFSKGVHEATATFDIGNPDLRIEKAKTVEMGLRRAKGPFRFELTGYYTRFDGFIFRRLTGLMCDDDFNSCGAGTELNQAVYTQRDAIFRGGELQFQFDVAKLWTGVWGIEGQYDIVRATFTDGTNVPRIPPQRVGGGVYWRDSHWLTRVFLLHAFPQNNIAVNETPTAGYDLLKAELSYTRKLKGPEGPYELTVGVSGNNLLDADIRNHVSFKKDEVLLPGRNVKLFASFKF